ncbi:Hint domain-containing protein [Nereida sp. MMG025]|uniref:Hint domain-containing protein n=1 Tax=Nereida sp. MMG025 TaxID=2909981 RepID=UPI001F3ED869|nr:Hint domain-containing protein [Nereida sp. MMG025]MCF6445567.1 Hint domain-containing protein [Nereida sp. MMG025]
MTNVTGYMLFDTVDDDLLSPGDAVSGGQATATVPTASVSPTHFIYVDYPSLGPVSGFAYWSGTDYWFVPDDPTGFPPNELGTVIRQDDISGDTGTAGNDSFSGASGGETYSGLQGDDTIATGSGDDRVFGDSGDDKIQANSGNDVVYGGRGNDSLSGNAGDDEVYGEAGDDTLRGRSGQDTLSGGGGDDWIEGGLDSEIEADTLEGGEGNDTIYGGGGNDVIWGDRETLSISNYASEFSGPATTLTVTNSTDAPIELRWIDSNGNDVFYKTIQPGQTITQATWIGHNWFLADQDGNPLHLIIGGNQTIDYGADGLADTLEGGAGNDSILGQFGDDSIDGGDGQDTISGGSGDDLIKGGADADSITGDDGDDQIFGESGNDSIAAGSGRDTVYGGLGSDTIRGNGGNDTLYGEADNDSIEGNVGNDYVDGGLGDDTLSGGMGSDTVVGGTGDDTLSGDAGDDTLTGGDGDDTFVYTAGDGQDVITDFNFGNTGALGDGDTTNNDFINLSQFYDRLSELRDDLRDDGVLNQSNADTVDYADNSRFQSGDSLTFQGAQAASFTADNTGVPCFTQGTLIATANGQVPVEHLRIGDMIQTADNGLQPILWTGMRELHPWQLARRPELRPVVLIGGGPFGNDSPLFVSPQHRVVTRGAHGGECFVAAKKLINLPKGKTRIARGKTHVRYVHFMTPRHEVVFANDVPCETFWPGAMALGGLHSAQRAEIAALFPSLLVNHGHKATPRLARVGHPYGAMARPCRRRLA